MLIKNIIGLLFLLVSMVTCVIAVIGVYRFDYVLNRMHAAAMIDTLGLLLAVVGVGILFFDIFPVLKLIFIISFFWLTSPVSSHRIARVESLTNRNLSEHLVIRDVEIDVGDEEDA